MTTEIIMALVGLFCTTASSVVTFILTKKKYSVEVESQQIQNIKDSFDVYKDMMEKALYSQKQAMEETILSQNQRIETLQRENEMLRNQFNQLQSQMMNLLLGQKLGIGDFQAELLKPHNN